MIPFLPARAFHALCACAHTENNKGIKTKNKVKEIAAVLGKIFSKACFNSKEVVVLKNKEVVCTAHINFKTNAPKAPMSPGVPNA